MAHGGGSCFDMGRGTLLMKVLVVMALSVPHAHAATKPPSAGGGETSRGGAMVPAPTPAPPVGDVPVADRGAYGEAAAVVIKRDMYKLMELCQQEGCKVAPSKGRDGEEYVVTTGTSAAAAGEEEEERDREGEGQWRCRRRIAAPRQPTTPDAYRPCIHPYAATHTTTQHHTVLPPLASVPHTHRCSHTLCY